MNMASEVAIETTMETNVGVVAFKSASITDVQGIADATDEIREFVGNQGVCRPKSAAHADIRLCPG